MSNNMAKIAEARKTVEQLKLEVNIDRMKVPGRLEMGPGSAQGRFGGGARIAAGGFLKRWAVPGRCGTRRGGAMTGARPGQGAWSRRSRGRGREARAAPHPPACLQVSQAAAELLAFCETHAKDDPLVTPVPAAENPFRDKRLFCVLL